MPPAASPPENTSHPPARFRGLWLAGAGIATLLVLWLASRWAYDHIPGVHYRVRVAWAWAYDQVIPPSDALPTPVNTPQQLVLATRSIAPATPTAAPNATAVPTVTGAAAISPTPGASPSATPLPPTVTAVPGVVLLKGFHHEQQYFNNCGPTTLAIDLSYWGWKGDQHAVAADLRPNQDDKNVSPPEMQSYLEANGYEAVVRVNGDVDTLKRFIAAGYPVIVQKGLVCKEGDDHCTGWVGHYALVIGYNDARKQFTFEDSFRGSGIKLIYRDLLAEWRAFNYTYIVAYPAGAARHAEVLSLLGEAEDVQRNYEAALARAQEEAAASKYSPAAFAWFNVGTNLTALGDYQAAAAAYDEARQIKLPSAMLWYQFGPFRAYFEAGRYDDVEHLTSFAISAAHLSGVEEAYYWRGRTREALGQHDKAFDDYRSALAANPTYQLAQQALKPATEMP
jgi:peptidase C39-like protein/tetratricopeptide repeat protein